MDWSPILISLKTGAVSIFFTFFLGLFAAWLVVSRKKESSKVVLDGLFTMPLVLPPTVAGFFLLLVFGANGPVGKLALSV
ncbi:MAG: molybdate ABC transporter permease subunit, partial [Firmicutes bacterium]|nr:molybdate ABC transporter permease subunit [Bacillota bacterium]